MKKEINIDCGTFQVYDNYLVGTINEGAIFDEDCKEEIFSIYQDNFNDSLFGYISNRVHSYTIDPTIYLDSSRRFINMKAMAVVTNRSKQRQNVKLEQQFFKGKMEVFDSIEEAAVWIRKTLNSYSSIKSIST